ncbi:MAG: energy-coupling factor transporter transmembrane protein EcfT [Hoeflea sp.]|uniref:energy-coupling factor transporter transmembrane component T family protein n=1 Tax=Hoeflea sp. TaxID=1940281 RepID=UPI0032F06B20
MLTDLYVFGDSPIHRARPAVKIVALAAICTALFVFEGWTFLLLAAMLVIAGFGAAGLRPVHALGALKPALWILAAIFAAQIYLNDVSLAGFVVGRFAVMILAATLVTLTTTSSEFVEGIHSVLRYAPDWVPKARIALAISLCFRFIPLVRSVLAEVRQAQHARGLGRNPLAVLVPLIVRTLKTADEVSQAIYARSFD